MKRKTITFMITALLLISGLSASAYFKDDSKESHELIIRLSSYDSYKDLPVSFEIVGRSVEGAVDVIISSEERSLLDASDFSYSVVIDDVAAYDDSVRESYKTFSEMESFLSSVASTYPDITKLTSIGTSYEGRDIWCLEISDNPGVDEDEPGVFYMGLHHAREWPSLAACVYIIEQLTSNYGVNSTLTGHVDTNRIWVVPCVNPDGYVYDHDQGNDWRKNRHYFSQYGSYGVDLNRNYPGACNGEPWGTWGSMPSSHVTHQPSQSQYVGPLGGSELETQAIMNMFRSHDICASLTFHTYSELVLWPWGYSTSETTPDNAYLSSVGTAIAQRITTQSGYGTYDPGQSSSLYPTGGDTTDWAYGYGHYVQGRPVFAYTIEMCSSFHPSESYLDQIVEENWDGALYLLQEAETIRDTTPRRVAPPMMNEPIQDSFGWTISWDERNPEADVDYFEVEQFSNVVMGTDDCESDGSAWILDGFSQSSDDSYSGSQSYVSRQQSSDVSSMTSAYPLYVTEGMSLSFATNYDIEYNYDYGTLEVSLEGRSFDMIDNFTGSSDGWVQKTYSLEQYVGTSVFFRFRHVTDSSTLGDGFFVDDISPVVLSADSQSLSNSIGQTSFELSSPPQDLSYYRVRGHNSDYGWCDFGCLVLINNSADLSAPSISSVVEDADPMLIGGSVTISCSVEDPSGVQDVRILIDGPAGFSSVNATMSDLGGGLFSYSDSYSIQGEYFYSFLSEDSLGNAAVSSQYLFCIINSSMQTKSFSYRDAWNLFTLPYNTSYLASSLCAQIPGALMVSGFDASVQSYNTYFAGGPASFDFELLDGAGYFVFSEQNCSVTLAGMSVDSVSVPLFENWNLLGWYHLQDTTASSLSENISGSEMVSWFNEEAQSYETYFVGGPSSFDFTITQGMGVFVFTTISGVWEGEG